MSITQPSLSVLDNVQNPTLSSQDKIEAVKQIVKSKFPNVKLTSEEVFLLVGFTYEKGLSFFSNDFYIYPIGGKNQIVVSIEGIRKISRSNGGYSLRFQYINEKYEIANYPNSSKPFIIKALLKMKSGEELEKDILFSEYTTGKNLWQTKPFVMIQKVAEASILRMAFELGGMYIQEEFGDNNNIIESTPNTPLIQNNFTPLTENSNNTNKIKHIKKAIQIELLEMGITEKKEQAKYIDFLKSSLEIKEDNLESYQVILEDIKQSKRNKEEPSQPISQSETQEDFESMFDEAEAEENNRVGY